MWPSITLAYSVHMKNEYQNVKILLSALKYDQFNWEVIGDFKMVAVLMGLQEASPDSLAIYASGIA